MLLRSVGVEPVHVVCDCKMVVGIWNAGVGQTLDNVAYAEVWREIFRKCEDLTALVTVEKFRSHQSWAKASAQ
eukprot:8710457-Pyramimonas_sp.AAC.1